MVAAIVHFIPDPINHWSVGAIWNVLIGVLAFLMISTIRYPSFKHIDLGIRRSTMNVYLLALLVALIYLYSQVVLLMLATIYASSGVLVKLYHAVKHRNEGFLAGENLVARTDDSD